MVNVVQDLQAREPALDGRAEAGLQGGREAGWQGGGQAAAGACFVVLGAVVGYGLRGYMCSARAERPVAYALMGAVQLLTTMCAAEL